MVVQLISVDVVYHFAGTQFPLQLLVHHNSMLRRVSGMVFTIFSALCNRSDQITVRAVFRDADQKVSGPVVGCSSLPCRVVFSLLVMRHDLQSALAGEFSDCLLVHVQSICNFWRSFPLANHLQNKRVTVLANRSSSTVSHMIPLSRVVMSWRRF